MIITNLTSWKIISIIFISCGILGCNVHKNDSLVKNQLQKCLDDFITNYSTFDVNNTDGLVSILIQKDEGFILMDAPKEFVLGTLNDIRADKSTYQIGTYKGVFCVYNKSDFTLPPLLLKKVSKSILEEAKAGSKFTFQNGKEIKIDYSNLNWQPEVTVFYDFKNMRKEIKTLSTTEPILLPWN